MNLQSKVIATTVDEKQKLSSHDANDYFPSEQFSEMEHGEMLRDVIRE
jgi:hypothetical protein